MLSAVHYKFNSVNLPLFLVMLRETNLSVVACSEVAYVVTIAVVTVVQKHGRHSHEYALFLSIFLSTIKLAEKRNTTINVHGFQN